MEESAYGQGVSCMAGGALPLASFSAHYQGVYYGTPSDGVPFPRFFWGRAYDGSSDDGGVYGAGSSHDTTRKGCTARSGTGVAGIV